MYDIEQAQPLYEGLPQETSEKPGNSPSWGLYSRKTKIGQSYDEFDNTNPTQLHRASPEDTIPMTRVGQSIDFFCQEMAHAHHYPGGHETIQLLAEQLYRDTVDRFHSPNHGCLMDSRNLRTDKIS